MSKLVENCHRAACTFLSSLGKLVVWEWENPYMTAIFGAKIIFIRTWGIGKT